MAMLFLAACLAVLCLLCVLLYRPPSAAPSLVSFARSLRCLLFSRSRNSRSSGDSGNLLPHWDVPMAAVSPAATKKSSYTYWVREKTEHAVPIPVPRKLSVAELVQNTQSAPMGSAWNQAGTWEEKNVTAWATKRVKEVLLSIEPLKFPGGEARITEISSCIGEATLVTVRNKKRVGYSYEIRMKFIGDWREIKGLEGTIRIPEASFNDLDEMQLEVSFTKEKGITRSDKGQLIDALKCFLPAVRTKLQKFEEELKGR